MHMFALMLGDRPFWCVFLERGGEGECSVYWGDYATPGVDFIFRWVSMVVDHGGILGEGTIISALIMSTPWLYVWWAYVDISFKDLVILSCSVYVLTLLKNYVYMPRCITGVYIK